MVTAVERNNQTCRVITFLRHLQYLQDLNKNFTNNEEKRFKNKVLIYEMNFIFSEVHGSMNATGPSGRHLLCMLPVVFILP